MALHYLIDENLTPAYRTELLRRVPELTVWAIGHPGAPPKNTPDPEILRWCEAESALLLTNNRKSMPAHLAEHLAAGHHVPGILVLDETRSMGEIVAELILIAQVSREDEYQDRIVYLPIE